jgi:hypothetical protein
VDSLLHAQYQRKIVHSGERKMKLPKISDNFVSKFRNYQLFLKLNHV